jgi:NADH:ubiquinone oxidoreductase subunit 3 (subunit A)
MRKQYSVIGGNISRMHPIAIVFLIAFVLSFLTTGIIKIASIIIFLVTLIYALTWLYQEIWG